MKSTLLLFGFIVGLLVVSCSDEPVAPGGSHTTPTYHATVQSLDGDFRSVCGEGTRDLYAIGPAILHYDGERWGTIDPPSMLRGTLRNAVGFPDDQLVVSDGMNVYVRKEGAWTDISIENMSVDDLWGSAPDDLYAVDYRGAYHFDGVSWNSFTLPGNHAGLRAVSGRSATDVVIGGDGGLVAHYDGAQWTSAIVDSFTSYQSVAITASGRIFTTDWNNVYEVTGATERVILRGLLDSPTLCADGETIYAAGALTYDNHYFVIARYQDDGWQNVALGQGDAADLWAGGGNVIAGGRNNFLWRGTAAGGQQETLYPRRGPMVDAANIGGAVFVVGVGAYRYEDGEWTDLNKEYVTQNVAWAVGGRSRDDVYAVGDNMILHYDGEQWSWVNGGLGQRLEAVSVEPGGTVLAAGGTPSLVQFDGNTWSTIEIPGNYHGIYDLWGAGETTFAVGSYGLIAIRTHGVWRVVPPVTDAWLYSVWGLDERHVYALGENVDEICVYDGRTWQTMPMGGPRLSRMQSIWGTSSVDLFVLDWTGMLLHFDGHDWAAQERVFPDGMSGLSGSGRDALAVGIWGAVSYRR